MRCYKCNSVLTDNPFCTSCGADVVIYKKVVRLSNAYYNMGLAKAQIRDLTGAADLLRRSVKFDKKNTNARNLLGLVYFEMGEAVQAFSEWIISKNIQPDKNIADDYIKRLQSNPVRLDTINQSIKKYNVALNYAKQENDDLAVIQLKKVLSTNQNLIKGHLLLSLLYMKKGEWEKARKTLNKVLKIDTNNPLAKKYMAEIKLQTDSKTSDVGREKKKIGFVDYEKEQVEKEIKNGYDINLPRRREVYRESNSGMMTVINVVIGVVVGVAATFFLLIPAKEKLLNDSHNKDVIKLNQQIESLNNDNTELQENVTKLESEKTDLNSQIESNGAQNAQVIADYDNLISASNLFNAKDYLNCANTLAAIADSNRSETFAALYQSIQPEAYKQAANLSYSAGKGEASSANSTDAYNKAIEDLTKVFNYDYTSVDYVSAADLLGQTYESQYDFAVSQNDIAGAGTLKQTAVTNMTNLINTLNANPAADTKAAENLQNHINSLQAK